ncbi:MarR family winged helix-turn-helix transcriptional regulator [Leifsonia sp. AG29]|uniref:MarR family winged helix-turn-helix transcriptional regulator n=1 Tax=Leifsonia sp. AG29 TaxID=2598860 RepID=UPI001E4E3094|nr:helix-turn-helix domain-containing protein [Leifsonia sp. AG29]
MPKPASPPPEPPQALTELIDEVFRTNGMFLAEGDELMSALGLTGRSWQVLGFLADGAVTASELARRRGLRRQSVQEAVNKLIASGHVSRRSNPADKRAPLLELTARGRATMVEIEAIRIEWTNRRAAAVPEEDLRAAIAVLRKLRETR